MKTINEILDKASVIRDEDEVGMNTAERVGSEFYDIAEWIENMSVFDVSKYTGQDFSNLGDAINAVPESSQVGGLILKFKTGDKYYQYFNTSSGWTGDISDWTASGDIDEELLKTGIDIANHTVSFSGATTELVGNFTIKGNTIINSGLTVHQSVNCNNNVSAMGTVSAGDGLSVNGNTSLDGTLEVSRSVSAGEGAIIKGTTTLSGNTAVAGALSVKQGASITGNTTINGNLQLNGIVNTNNDINVQGNISARNGLSVSGDTSMDGTLAVVHSISAGEGAVIKGITTLSGDTTVNGDEKITENLEVSGKLTLGDNLTVSGKTVSEKGLEVSGSTKFYVDTEDGESFEIWGVSGTTSTKSQQAIAIVEKRNLDSSGNYDSRLMVGSFCVPKTFESYSSIGSDRSGQTIITGNAKLNGHVEIERSETDQNRLTIWDKNSSSNHTTYTEYSYSGITITGYDSGMGSVEIKLTPSGITYKYGTPSIIQSARWIDIVNLAYWCQTGAVDLSHGFIYNQDANHTVSWSS